MFGTISDFFTTVEASIIGLKRYVSATVCAEIIYYYTYIIYGLCMRVAKLAQSGRMVPVTCSCSPIPPSLNNVQSICGVVCDVDSGDVKVVLNEGMPHHRNPFDKGRLIINFKVNTYIRCISYAVRTST